MSRKGIILAGGSGTRLHPSTISVSKQLMPVYDKPMIYYPLSVLMEAGLKEILIITTPHDRPAFENLLSDGRRWGLDITYAVQPSPDGLAQALIIAEEFLDGSPSALILGDNLFFGAAAVTGLYFYDNKASEYAKTLKPSARGELEITALNQVYLDRGELRVEILDNGTTWLDTGTHRSLLQAAQFVSVIEERQGQRICCPEVISYRNGWIDKAQLARLAVPLKKSGYGIYLQKILDGIA